MTETMCYPPPFLHSVVTTNHGNFPNDTQSFRQRTQSWTRMRKTKCIFKRHASAYAPMKKIDGKLWKKWRCEAVHQIQGASLEMDSWSSPLLCSCHWETWRTGKLVPFPLETFVLCLYFVFFMSFLCVLLLIVVTFVGNLISCSLYYSRGYT